MARSFYGKTKRALNRRIKAELGVALHLPTYRDVLSAMWAYGSWRGGCHRAEIESIVELATGEQSGFTGDPATMELKLHATVKIEPKRAFD